MTRVCSCAAQRTSQLWRLMLAGMAELRAKRRSNWFQRGPVPVLTVGKSPP